MSDIFNNLQIVAVKTSVIALRHYHIDDNLINLFPL